MSEVEREGKSGAGLEDWLTYAGVLLAPFINLRIGVAYTLSSAFYTLAFAAMLYRGTLPRSPMGVLTWTWFPACFLIILGLHVSSLVEGNALRGIILTVEYAFSFIVLPCVLMKPSLRQSYRLLVIFASGVVLLDLHGIVTFFGVGYRPGSLTVTGNMRLATLIANPNGAACLNAIAILLLAWLLAERRIPKTLGLAYVAVTTLALVLTSSNTGLLVVAAGLSTYAVLTLRLQSLLRILFVASIPVAFFSIAGATYLPATFQKRVLSALVDGDVSEAGTFLDRADLNREALDIIERHRIWLVGLGADQFRTISVQQAPVHNVFLILWVEGGILSLFGWLILMSSGFVLWARARARGLMFHGRAVAFAAFVVFFVVSNARAHLYTPYWYTAILLILGPTIAVLRQEGRSPSSAVVRRSPPNARDHFVSGARQRRISPGPA